MESGIMRALAFFASLYCVVAPLRDPHSFERPVPRVNWPQPIMRGTIVLVGSPVPKPEVAAAFAKLPEMRAGKLAVLSTRPAGQVKADWAAAGVTDIVVFPSVEALIGAPERSVWIELSEAPAEPQRSQLRRSLIQMRDQGGLIAGPTWLAEKVVDKRIRDGLGLIDKSVGCIHQQDSFPPPLTKDALKSGFVELGVSLDGAMVLRGRTILNLNEMECTVNPAVGAGAAQSWSGRVGLSKPKDYIAQQRISLQAGKVFPPTIMRAPQVSKGTLFIVGGGGMPEGLAKEFIAACGGPDAPIVFIPCTESEVAINADREAAFLRQAGATHVTVVHTKDRDRANKDEAILQPLRDAKGIWFGGGRQWNLADSYQNTLAHELMAQVLDRGGAIGGSSAGASIQSEYMPRGDPLGNLNIIAPGYEQGLGFLPGCGVDQHFTQRKRLADLQLLTKAYPQLLGIGIDESTAIIVRGKRAEVKGRGTVTFLRPSKGVHVVLKDGQGFDFTKLPATGP